MEILMNFLNCFLVGGTICVIGQILIDKTKLTTARILVFFVTLGVVLTALNVYQPIVDFGRSGATVPLTGFGYSLATGVEKAVDEEGFIGIFTGGIKNTSAGITAAMFFGFISVLVSKPDIPSKK